MVRFLAGALALSVCWICGAGALRADVIRGAVGVSATVTGFPGAPTALINQSGLSTPYVSGITNFSTYVASTTHAFQTPNPTPNIWGGGAGNLYFLSFDLGAVYPINGLAVWNLISSQTGTTSLRLYTDTDGNLLNGLGPALGTYSINAYSSVGDQSRDCPFVFGSLHALPGH